MVGDVVVVFGVTDVEAIGDVVLGVVIVAIGVFVGDGTKDNIGTFAGTAVETFVDGGLVAFVVDGGTNITVVAFVGAFVGGGGTMSAVGEFVGNGTDTVLGGLLLT